ncbi:MAG: FG-GAP-like repeat-containing protein [Pyrinomonadaceae bacterium]
MKKFAVIWLIVIGLAACRTSPVPEKSSENYKVAVSAFYIGLAALQVGDDQRAAAELEKTVQLAAGEPAGWNNLGVLQIRQKDFDNAEKSLETARRIVPDNYLIYSNLATLEIQRGNFPKAVENLKKTVALNPLDLQALYALAGEMERQAEEKESLKYFRKIFQHKPDNPAVVVELTRLSAKTGDKETLDKSIKELEGYSQEWPAETREQLEKLKKAAVAGDQARTATEVVFLRNLLLGLPEFRAALSEIKPSDTSIGQPMPKPLKLPVPDFDPAEPDSALTFSSQPEENAKAVFAKVFFFNGDDPPALMWADEKELHVGKNAALPVAPTSPSQAAAFDFDFDFRNDLAVADQKGFHLFRQTDGGNFEDVTKKTGLSAALLQKPYVGVWTLDIESDGDLDLILGPKESSPVFLQNNGDGTFRDIETFIKTEDPADFISADFDEDGDADAVLLDESGAIHYFSNERGGTFAGKDLKNDQGKIASLAAGDIGGDGRIRLIAAPMASSIVSFSAQTDGQNFGSETLAGFPEDFCKEKCSLKIADLDNNGANDILLSNGRETQIFLGGKDRKFSPATNKTEASVSSVADMNGDGRLDLIGIDAEGRPAVFLNQSAKNYHWQILRPRAAKTEGDQRINSFGIGGEMEIRSGLLAQKQLIASPQVHFGLGESEAADVLRVIWANGYVQAEFDLKSDQVVPAEQRLKGSCPHLFAWNGQKFELVKDAPPWSPALGLKINAQDTYGVLQTEEWFKIPGEALKAKDGFYELRITGEYWESFYIDNYRLLAVDHPADTEIFTDERFAVPLPPLKVFTTGKPLPFARATDHNRRDVADIVRDLDENYLDGIKRGRFQGVAEEHFVELELPPDAPRDKKIWLIADGWVHPTDASINVQRGQGRTDPPESLAIEVEDENGEWKTVRKNLGFPAGKMKTVLLDLSGIFPENAENRRFRLKTELEIFWDKLAWAVDLPENRNETQTLDLQEAKLNYRGFSVIEKRDDSSPEKPVYDRILTTNQRWRDLEGFYTRFGDVLELLQKTDDRFVLANAGDELVLKFPALAEVREGWKRDFVIIGNGWIKDGDLNSVFSKTLLPLPTHATNDYTRRPTALEDDPVYRKNRADWLEYHTRYVAPTGFRNALRKQ